MIRMLLYARTLIFMLGITPFTSAVQPDWRRSQVFYASHPIVSSDSSKSFDTSKAELVNQRMNVTLHLKQSPYSPTTVDPLMLDRYAMQWETGLHKDLVHNRENPSTSGYYNDRGSFRNYIGEMSSNVIPNTSNKRNLTLPYMSTPSRQQSSVYQNFRNTKPSVTHKVIQENPIYFPEKEKSLETSTSRNFYAKSANGIEHYSKTDTNEYSSFNFPPSRKIGSCINNNCNEEVGNSMPDYSLSGETTSNSESIHRTRINIPNQEVDRTESTTPGYSLHEIEHFSQNSKDIGHSGSSFTPVRNSVAEEQPLNNYQPDTRRTYERQDIFSRKNIQNRENIQSSSQSKPTTDDEDSIDPKTMFNTRRGAKQFSTTSTSPANGSPGDSSRLIPNAYVVYMIEGIVPSYKSEDHPITDSLLEKSSIAGVQDTRTGDVRQGVMEALAVYKPVGIMSESGMVPFISTQELEVSLSGTSEVPHPTFRNTESESHGTDIYVPGSKVISDMYEHNDASVMPVNESPHSTLDLENLIKEMRKVTSGNPDTLERESFPKYLEQQSTSAIPRKHEGTLLDEVKRHSLVFRDNPGLEPIFMDQHSLKHPQSVLIHHPRRKKSSNLKQPGHLPSDEYKASPEEVQNEIQKPSLPNFGQSLHLAEHNSITSNKNGVGDKYLNEVADFIIDVMDRGIKLKGKSNITVPDINEEFSKRIVGIKVNGEFHGRNGWFSDLSSLYRTADVVVSRSNYSLSVQFSLGLAKMQFGFGHYEAKLAGIREDGQITGEVKSNSMSVKVSVNIDADNKCNISLDDFKVTELGEINLDITGLGKLKWLFTRITSWVTEHYKDDIIKEVQKNIITEVNGVLNTVKC